MRIVEGTILSIARAAAEGARAHCETLIALVRRRATARKDALAFTPEQLAGLEAGRRRRLRAAPGSCCSFDALCHVVARRPAAGRAAARVDRGATCTRRPRFASRASRTCATR